MRCRNGWGRALFCRIMEAFRGRCGIEAESRLKNGDLKAVVATASLELGIDIGTVDLAIQIGSPRSIAVALQRDRALRALGGAKPRGIFFPTTRDELIETAAVIHAVRGGSLEEIEIPENALDILAQQMVAECACEDYGEDELFQLVRGAYPYRNLPRADYDAVLTMLADGIATTRGRSGALLHRDQVNHRVRGRRGARLAAITSGGAIPDTAAYAVIRGARGQNDWVGGRRFCGGKPDGRRVSAGDTFVAYPACGAEHGAGGRRTWRATFDSILAGRSAGAIGGAVRSGLAGARDGGKHERTHFVPGRVRAG